MVVLEVIIEGLAIGTIYSGLALALVLIYRTTGVINFAQGEMGMFCTFVIWWLSEHGLSIHAAIAVGLGFAFVLGMAIERIVIRPIGQFGEFPTAITTLGLFLVSTNWRLGFGARKTGRFRACSDAAYCRLAASSWPWIRSARS
jgi:branched-chain amino acid transport system permease protein